MIALVSSIKKKLLKINLSSYFLFFIFLISLYFRFFELQKMPTGFFGDEAALVYNGWSLMTTLKDEYGKFLPLTLQSFDDNKPAIYAYLTIPFISIFGGANEFSARAPAALSGSLLVILLYFYIKKITQNKNLALVSSFVLAITPWHLEISRTAIEAGVGLFFSVLSLYFATFKEKKKIFLSLFFGVLALYTYHSTRLLLPLLIVISFIFKLIKTKSKTRFLLIGIIFLGLTLSFFSSSQRFAQISIFSDLGNKLKQEEAIREDGAAIKVGLNTPILVTRLLHNKYWYYFYSFVDSYFTNTSIKYLFLGGAQPPRVTIPETGQFLIVFLPFFFLGIFAAIKEFRKDDQFILAWLLLAPIPASLTHAETPHTYRTIFLLIPITYLIAKGFLFLISLVQDKFKNLLVILFIGVSFLNLFKAWHQYYIHQQVHQPWHRQFGYKNLFNYLKQEDFEKVVITNKENEPYIFYLLYNKIEPKVYQAWPEKRLEHQAIESGKNEFSIFNYKFSESHCPHDELDINPKNLYVVHFTCEKPKNFERINTINFLDGNPEFFVDRPLNK